MEWRYFNSSSYTIHMHVKYKWFTYAKWRNYTYELTLISLFFSHTYLQYKWLKNTVKCLVLIYWSTYNKQHANVIIKPHLLIRNFNCWCWLCERKRGNKWCTNFLFLFIIYITSKCLLSMDACTTSFIKQIIFKDESGTIAMGLGLQ